MNLHAQIMNLPVDLAKMPSGMDETQAVLYLGGHRDARHAAAELVLVAMAWQPIETAPKDSKARLVWVPENGCIFNVSWTNGHCGPGEDGDPPGWIIFGGGYRAYLRDGRATHWMPPPPPPEPTA